MKSQKGFFLVSFFPALAYWYLESHYSVRIAVIGGLSLAVLEIFLEKIFLKKVHQISVANFFLILILSTLSVLGDEGLWFRLQPSVTGVAIGLFLFYKSYFSSSFFKTMMLEMGQKSLPDKLIIPMERDVALLFLIYGLWMIYVALNLSTSEWLFYKTAGFYLIFFVFMVVEFFLMRRRLRV